MKRWLLASLVVALGIPARAGGHALSADQGGQGSPGG
jgi:hypothetical protein